MQLFRPAVTSSSSLQKSRNIFANTWLLFVLLPDGQAIKICIHYNHCAVYICGSASLQNYFPFEDPNYKKLSHLSLQHHEGFISSKVTVRAHMHTQV